MSRKPTRTYGADERVGFYVQLPQSTVNEIRRRSSRDQPQWVVIVSAIAGTKKGRK